MKRTSFGRRAKRSLRNQLGMTLLEIMIVLAIIALVMGFLVGPRVLSMFQESKVETTKLMVKQIANEAYTHWAMKSQKQCPDSLMDLEKYTNTKPKKGPNGEKGLLDSWGNHLVMLCGDKAPEGSNTGFAILSKGEDGKQNTDDDIKSWE